MKILQRFHILLPLFMSLIIGTMSYVQGDPLAKMATKLVIVIIAFYILGYIARSSVQAILLENALDIDLQMSQSIDDMEAREQEKTGEAEEAEIEAATEKQEDTLSTME